MNESPNTQAWLEGVRLAASTSGRPDEDFFYLGGPMTGIPRHNFDRFDEIAAKLRGQGYNIVSPAELDAPETRERFYNCMDGTLSRDEYEQLLGRDLVTVSLPTCIGGIFIEGWENSRGAAAESWVLSYLNRPLYEYHEQTCDDCQGDGDRRVMSGRSGAMMSGGFGKCFNCGGTGTRPMLVWFDRDEHLLSIHGDPSVAGTVPTHKPGERTLAARDVEAYEAMKAVHESGSDEPYPLMTDNLRTQGLV